MELAHKILIHLSLEVIEYVQKAIIGVIINNFFLRLLTMLYALY